MKKKARTREKHRLCRWKITLVGVLGICLAVWYAGECISHAIWPALREVAQHECRTVVVQTIHEALRQELSNHPGRYETLYTVEHGVVQGDSMRLNAARLSLVGAAEQALETLPDKTITIPLGALSGSIFCSIWDRAGRSISVQTGMWRQPSQNRPSRPLSTGPNSPLRWN